MIKRINSIKNLGIFTNYKYKETLKDFKKFNIIYGWNGSGKTTLSKLFTYMASHIHEDFPDLQFEIDLEDNKKITEESNILKNLRIFNEQYISENINLTDCKTRPILILGKENQDVIDKIKENDKDIEDLQNKIEESTKRIKNYKEAIDEHFTRVATIIGINTTKVKTRTYTRVQAKDNFHSLRKKELLTTNELEKLKLDLNTEERPILPLLDIHQITFELDDCTLKAKTLEEKIIPREVDIQKYKRYPDLSEWVEKGLRLHEIYQSNTCEFCENELSKSRINILKTFFNKETSAFKIELDLLIKDLQQIYQNLDSFSLHSDIEFYPNIRNKYINEKSSFIKELTSLKSSTLALIKELELKKQKTTKNLTSKVKIDTKHIKEISQSINSLISENNKFTNNSQQYKEIAISKIEKHFLSTIFDDVRSLEDKSQTEEISCNASQARLDTLTIQTNELRESLTNTQTACQEINSILSTFFGHTEIELSVEQDGYLIKRNGKLAKNLSAGEMRILSLIYFINQLNDKDFDKEKGFVVIDDPISSLDSNSIYQAFGLIRTTLPKLNQSLILTHNYDFLRLIINWLTSNKDNNKEATFYMIRNILKDNLRTAFLDNLDPLILNYHTEYNYQFKILFEAQNSDDIARAYSTPNIARKFLDNYLNTMIPINESEYKKLMDHIDYPENEKISLYKFVNNESHPYGNGLDPIIVKNCQNNIKSLLKLVEKNSPEHFKYLKQSIK